MMFILAQAAAGAEIADLAQATPSATEISEMVQMTHQFYHDAWSRLTVVLGFGLGIIGVGVPLLVQWILSRTFDRERRHFEKALHEQRTLVAEQVTRQKAAVENRIAEVEEERTAQDERIARQETNSENLRETVTQLADRLFKLEVASVSHLHRADIMQLVTADQPLDAMGQCDVQLAIDLEAKDHLAADTDTMLLCGILDKVFRFPYSLGDRKESLKIATSALKKLKGVSRDDWPDAPKSIEVLQKTIAWARGQDSRITGEER